MNWDAEEFKDVVDDFFLGKTCLSPGEVERSRSGAKTDGAVRHSGLVIMA